MSGEKQNYNEVKNEVMQHLPQVYTGTHDAIYEEDTLNMKDFVIGALVGGIVGAAAGMLLAPKTGRDLRSDVATQAVQLKDRSVTLSSTAKEKTVQISNQLKEQSTQLVDKVKAKTTKVPPVFDDGTVNYEGEEPLEDTYEGVDMAEIARPSSI
ncbi:MULTISPECIES: YtxH domain-containing protein [Lysinibacillus]|uniref:YtxH domain-containing protein n=1 Tax=Lysinibacillus antri TaxID=2498145 RepID=A0A432LHJ0_9BACI|nr:MULTISPECIES: YtxH domain-containing protein [Lysinibacillus]RUL56512.1 YtxH domain-containing protein [Lysinibacillus antri]TSI03077.1 YtxH domain-containing protein [Lysinibacillus sp. BW-2-10]